MYKVGSKGKDVKKIQYKLRLKPDGVFGSKTSKAVLEWQERENLTADGVVGEVSWYRMFGVPIHKFAPLGVVVHSMSEKFDVDGEVLSAKEFLDSIGLSAHCLIHPDGRAEYPRGPYEKAYHAGKSRFRGLSDLNDFFLGIELLVEGVNTYDEFVDKIKREDTFTDNHYNTLTSVIKAWSKCYNFSIEDITRHSDISGDDIRGEGKGKVDPGTGFDWNRLINLI